MKFVVIINASSFRFGKIACRDLVTKRAALKRCCRAFALPTPFRVDGPSSDQPPKTAELCPSKEPDCDIHQIGIS
jgi:hypothetical protein